MTICNKNIGRNIKVIPSATDGMQFNALISFDADTYIQI